jgi:3-oxoacyl-[acyl-carrier protein] reductase
MPVIYDFRGRTAVVTGGAKGIGRTIANRLAVAGAQVWVWDVVPTDAEGIRYNSVDVTRGNDIAKALADVLLETDRIDILVNNAGYAGGTTRIEEFDPEAWRRILEINITAGIEVGAVCACASDIREHAADVAVATRTNAPPPQAKAAAPTPDARAGVALPAP